MNRNNAEEYQILSKQQMPHYPTVCKEHDNPDSISSMLTHPDSPLNLLARKIHVNDELIFHLPGKFSTDNWILKANCNDAVNSSI